MSGYARCFAPMTTIFLRNRTVVIGIPLPSFFRSCDRMRRFCLSQPTSWSTSVGRGYHRHTSIEYPEIRAGLTPAKDLLRPEI